MKEKATYRRFDFPSFLAILGCIGMLLFEGIFVFELYDRSAAQPETAVPVQAAPAADLPNGPKPAEVAVPVVPASPVEVSPAEVEKAPAAAVPVG